MFFLRCLKYIRQKEPFPFIVKHSGFLCVPQNIHVHFHSLKMITPIFSVVHEAKGMKFCMQVLRTYVRNC